ncbi:hypothetical protein [Pseudomonas veronii]|uniref:hypothetical protein n=1 Tax=Pseudomonas veronii TaxID=76761 RepID=UPI0010C42D54|nr:hypothetical protein [Pseudomonas veronii]
MFVDGNRPPLLSSRGDIAVQGDVAQGNRALGGGVVQCVGQADACINAINVEKKVLIAVSQGVSEMAAISNINASRLA